ncbi:MAG TPA: UDP-N-acetylmuramoyl-tripeptide--D-alanyl-D-alanine ligase [Verrucomicrobiales bacterium]|nr:UDP-N-acetylmuramoyl-tripeptide--D-alanyl-D-alanine ligase [Verrucomicrobiales bacterium]HRJ08806.1 UDP-N-acetylmuramoyl-tripeptide--D-alanyl-D-alanine ligase [Prosthecobacter sp.]
MMKAIPLQTLLSFCPGIVRRAGDSTRAVTRVVTDSRAVQPGDVFVALKGERFDAHDFIPQAAASGASAVIVSHVDEKWSLPEHCALMEAPDTLTALQNLARGYRSWHKPLLIGLTGSNGKTTTKDFAAAVMSAKFQTRATAGNLNNHIGVPLTLLSLQDGDECAVVEMGMNHPGEIRTLVDTALPDAAILTNVGIAHIEHMGSRDAIAWEKGTLPANVPGGGTVVLPADDDYTPLIARHCQARVLTAGIESGDVSASELERVENGTRFKLDFRGESAEVFLPVIGRHMVVNAALAACMGWAQGIAPEDIAAALSRACITGGRMQVLDIGGVVFINDSYNANPDSVMAGILALRTTGKGRKHAVLGRMGELGARAEEEHARIGRSAASTLDSVITVGDGEARLISQAAADTESFDPCHTAHFATHEECAAHLRQLVKPGDAVLVKGSRSTRMERVLELYQQS